MPLEGKKFDLIIRRTNYNADNEEEYTISVSLEAGCMLDEDMVDP